VDFPPRPTDLRLYGITIRALVLSLPTVWDECSGSHSALWVPLNKHLLVGQCHVSYAPIDAAHQLCICCACQCTLARRVALLFPHHPQSYYLPSTPPFSPLMSHTHPTSPSSSNFQLIFDNALRAYQTRIRKDLLTHPLAAQLEDCNSPSNILDVLQQQVEELNRSQRRNEKWTSWLDPTVKVLHAFSGTLGEHVALVCLGFNYQLVSEPRSHAYLTGISTGKSHLYCSRRPSSGVYRFICSYGPS
jgi:hypothetical protein